MANWVTWFLLSSQSPVALPVFLYPIIVPLAAGGDHLPEKASYYTCIPTRPSAAIDIKGAVNGLSQTISNNLSASTSPKLTFNCQFSSSSQGGRSFAQSNGRVRRGTMSSYVRELKPFNTDVTNLNLGRHVNGITWREVLRTLCRQDRGSRESSLLSVLSVLPSGNTRNTQSMPSVHRYIGGLMEQPWGLSMVNSQYRLYTLHLATPATHSVTCPLLLRHRTE